MSHPSDDDPVLKPGDLLAWRRAHGQLREFPAPHTVILTPQKSLADDVLRRHSTRQVTGFLGQFHLLKRTNGRVALSTGFGIGAPVVAGLADEFAALGVRQFVLVGLAGGIRPELTTGSIILSSSAIRGEGVSGHYLPPERTVDTSERITRGISNVLMSHNHVHTTGITWTTDAPFRERRRDVLDHQKQGVLAVDMEAAALLAVARSLNQEAAAVFAIADRLSDGYWRMARDLRPAHRGLSILFDAVLEYLEKKSDLR
jgi:uridine phosphorylase